MLSEEYWLVEVEGKIDVNEIEKRKNRVSASLAHFLQNYRQQPQVTSLPGLYQHVKKHPLLLPLRHRIQLVLLCLLLAACLSSSLLAMFASILYGPLYSRDMALAHTGVQHLRNAQSLLLSLQKLPLNKEIMLRAQQEFGQATLAFDRINTDVKTVSPLLTRLPFVAERFSAIQYLVPMAVDFSRAGGVGCHLLQQLVNILHDPLNQGKHMPIVEDTSLLVTDLHTIHMLVQEGLNELDKIEPGQVQLGSQIDGQLVMLRQYEPQIRQWLILFEHALPFLPRLLGNNQPASYLLEMLDSSELRPAGGFIGNYGFLTLDGGHLQKVHITDVDLLDLPFEKSGGFIPFPPEYRWFPLSHGQWSLRDSNLDADFPTSAQAGLKNYQLEGGHIPIQGLIAITPALIEHVLAITGPLFIPDYHDTITSQNLVERIHYYQLGAGRHGSGKVLSPDGLSSQRKHFTALLAEHFFTRLRHLSNPEIAQLVHLLLNSLQTKDVQLYFSTPDIEALLSQAHIDSAVQHAPDGLFVVDANINGNKANSFIRSTVTDVVNIDPEGNATHSVTLRYAWTLPGDVFGKSLYRAYIQLYAPANSHLQDVNGWGRTSITRGPGNVVWSGTISLLYGNTTTVMLSWIVPHAVQHDKQGKMHFVYLFQKQAGIERSLHLQVNFPACAVIQKVSGAAFERSAQTAWLTQVVTHDLRVGFDYTCP